MRRLEASIERRFIQLLDDRGITHLKLNVNGNRGWPDRIVFLPGGRPVLVELKRQGEEPRPLQVHVHRELRQMGYPVIVSDDPDKVYLLILQHGGIPR